MACAACTSGIGPAIAAGRHTTCAYHPTFAGEAVTIAGRQPPAATAARSRTRSCQAIVGTDGPGTIARRTALKLTACLRGTAVPARGT